MPRISALNRSPEKTLEKAIVQCSQDWVNQIPVASGLMDTEQRLMSVDLGRKCGAEWYELVELKAGQNADTPLRASIEILCYGLLYCFARLRKRELELPNRSEMLTARRIDLKVLAPVEVYAGFELQWLEDSIDRGIQEFTRERFGDGLRMSFAAESFPEAFRWPGLECADLLKMLNSRGRHWQA